MNLTHKKYAESFTKELFNDFNNNPSFCGPNFEWIEFPRLAERLAKVNCKLSFTLISDKDAEFIGNYAKKHAIELIDKLK